MKTIYDVKAPSGFYCGEKMFQLVLGHFGAISGGSTQFSHDGLTFYSDPFLREDQMLGVGYPYAEVVKEMEEHFKEKEDGLDN